MKEIEEDKLIQDLILISRKKQKIRETLAFTRKAHEVYLAHQRRVRIRLWTISISSVAAVFLLALVVLPSFLALDGTSQYNVLYTKYEPDIATRAFGPKDKITEVISLYTEGQNKQALILADSLLNSQPDNSKLLFFKGLTEMELNHPDQAARLFTQIIPQGGPIEAWSRWYLALIYLRQDNFTACRNQLAALKKIDDHPYKKEIDKLYHKLRFRRNQ